MESPEYTTARYRSCPHGIVSTQCQWCLADAFHYEQAMLADLRAAHPHVERCPSCDVPREAHYASTAWEAHVSTCNYGGEEPEGV